MSNPVALVVGAGPGLGAAVAETFGTHGYDVALIARSQERLTALGESLQGKGITTGWSAVDITDADALGAAVTRFGGHAGRIDVLHFNPSVFRAKDALSLTADELLDDVRLGAASLLTAVQAARPFLSAGARITATGSMAADSGSRTAPSLGVQKAALRSLVRSLDATLEPDGVRAMTLTVNGTLSTEGVFSPGAIALALLEIVRSDAPWRAEVPYPATV